jgi:DNA end-binding protein Ku
MMRFAEELVAADEIEPAEGKPASRRETELAMHLVDALSGPFDPSKHPDAYRGAVLSAVEAKVEAGETRHGDRGEEAAGKHHAGKPSPLLDLTTLLSQSLKGANDHAPARRVAPTHAARTSHATRGTKGKPVKAERAAGPPKKKRNAG